MEPDVPAQVTKALINIDTKILSLAYTDLAQPGVQQVGKALSTVLGLGNTALLPLKLVNEKAQLWFTSHMESYRKRLEQVPEDQIVEVAPEIGVPILEKLEKTTNPSLSELYINLLAGASVAETAELAHPRFVQIIESLAPDEVKILESFRKKSYTPFISLFQDKSVTPEGQKPNPFNTDTVTKKIRLRVTLFEITDILALRLNSSFYFQNLEALGLIRADDDFRLIGDEYDSLLKASEHIVNAPQESKDIKVRVEKGCYDLTSFGHTFLQACQNNKDAANE
jgi:hypothetical protein